MTKPGLGQGNDITTVLVTPASNLVSLEPKTTLAVKLEDPKNHG
jgi:hypothetical protein